MSRNADLDGTNHNRLEAPFFNRLCKLTHDLREDVSARSNLTTRRNLMAGSQAELIAQTTVLIRCGPTS